MSPLYQLDLRVRLSERRDRLLKAATGPFENELRLLLKWMRREPYLVAIEKELDALPTGLKQLEEAGDITIIMGIPFPDDEALRARICLDVCRACEAGQVRKWTTTVSQASKFVDQYRDFVEHIVDPLVNYLRDRLETGGSILAILERYKRRTEWFHQRELHDKYGADTARGEATLDAHLREYLVDQGIAYPFSQPHSPSGAADIVAELGGDEPLALEVKLFLPDAGKGDAYIRQGFAQIIRYANDYLVPAGYLVVFNLTRELLVFEGEESNLWPPTVSVGDKIAFLIAIQTNPDRPSASKDRLLKRHVITSAYLLDGVG